MISQGGRRDGWVLAAQAIGDHLQGFKGVRANVRALRMVGQLDQLKRLIGGIRWGNCARVNSRGYQW